MSICLLQWNTVCLELPHCYLKWVCSGLVSELKRQNRHIPALTIASAVNERLNSLLPTQAEGQSVDRALMFSEATRRQTFSKWPHMNYKLVIRLDENTLLYVIVFSLGESGSIIICLQKY